MGFTEHSWDSLVQLIACQTQSLQLLFSHYLCTMAVPNPIINKVAQKAIVSIDLADLLPKAEDIVTIDLKDFLFKGLILREAEFREQVSNTDWTQYQNKYVILYSSVDAIIPMWAFMVLTAELSPYSKDIANTTPTQALSVFLNHAIEQLDPAQYAGQRLVVKGCGDIALDSSAFVAITQKLSQSARAIMYGEPCSMVPVYRRVL